MSKQSKAITQLFERIDSTPFGPEERALIDQAVALAVEAGDEQLEHLARMRLTVSAKNSGDTDAMLASFAWCLAKHDEDPSRFPADLGDDGADLLWQYKWMAGTLAASPIFSRDQIDAVHADMHAHYERAGVGFSGYITSRFDEAWRNGRLDEAATLREQLAVTPRDDYSHCDACVRSEAAAFLAETGREESLILIAEMLDGGFSCGDEPENALSQALLPYLRAGRLDEAKSAHLRSYRLSRDNADKISIVANHLVFCAVTGNEARGLALLERHISWLAHDGLNVSAHFSTLLSYGALLDAIDAAGHGDTVVRGAESPDLVSFFGEHDGTWSVRDLAVAAWRAAAEIGAAFDERNGNDYHASRIARAHALAAEHYDVPIDTNSFTPAPVAVADPTDAAGWHARACELAATSESERAIAAARRALELGATGAVADELHSLILGSYVQLEQWDDATAALPARAASLRSNGRDAQAAFEDRVGLAAFGRVTAEGVAALESELANDSLPAEVRADAQLCVAAARIKEGSFEVDELLAASVAGFDTPTTQRGLRSALLFSAHVFASTQRLEQAVEAIDRFISLEAGRGDLGQAHLFRARVMGGLDRFDEGAREADEAARLFTLIDARSAAVEATSVAGSLLGDAERPDEAASRFRFAAQQLELLGAPATGMQFSYGRALVNAGKGEEAVEVLTGVLDDETAADAPAAARAETLFWIGHALQSAEQYGNAVSAWFSAAELYDEGEDSQGAAGAGLAAARLLVRFQEHDDALEALTEAAAQARKSPENLGLLTEVLHAYGSAQAMTQNAAGLETLDEVIAIARENGADWLVADVTDSRARALHALGRTDEGVALALEAADLYAAAGDPASGGGSELFVARLLVDAERAEEAVALYRSAIARAEGVPNLVSLASIELGDLLERLGRPDEAAAARAAAE